MTSEQRVAVVTGGAGAIGSAIVTALKESGHRTVVLSRSGEVSCDFTSEASTRRAAAEVLKRYGRCDVLVHASAAFDAMALDELDLARWRNVMAVNVEALLWLAKVFTPGMAKRGFGRIILISSDGLWSPPNGEFLPYLASKGAMLGVMRTLAVAYGGDGIAVTSVAPGLTETTLARSVVEDETFEKVVESQAMKRRLTPDDTGSVVAFLASDGAQALTGQVLVVDGGIHLR